MKKNFLLAFMPLLILTSMLFVSGCKKDDTNNGDNDEVTFSDLKIDPGFKFETTKSIDVLLNLNTVNSKEPPQKFYIYSDDPAGDGKLITSGLTDPYFKFHQSIKVPSYINNLFVVRKDVYGRVDKQRFDISSGMLHHTYDLTVKKGLKATREFNLQPDPGCSNCTPVSGNYGSLEITGNSCVPAGQMLNVTNLNIKGGTLVICGTANLNHIKIVGNSGGSLFVSSGGQLNTYRLETRHMDYLVNYGFINLPNNITVNEFDANCIIENRNEFNIAGNVKIASSTFYNDGRVSIAGTTENLGNIYNDHIFQVSGHFTNGSNADVTNNCQFIVTGHLHQHGKIENNDFIRTDQVLHFYENSTNVMGPQSLIAAGNVEIKSLIEGPTVNCAKIDVAVSTIITTSGSLTNNMDLCDENGIEENNGTIDPSVTFCNCYIPTTECNPGSGTPGDGGDSDNDGCPDDVDEYPNDPERCSNEYYPEEGKFSTLAFEDLWNSTGDYDFNDLVVETNYKIVKNGQNKVVEIFAKYHITAIGADLNNGFGIEFNTPGISIDTVIGSHLYGNAVTLKQNGIEEGPLNRTVVMVFDAINDYAGTAMVNTIPGGNSKTFDTIDIYIKFNHSVADIDPAPFNPFMFINQERGKETHMIDHAPTELVDVSYFGQNSDDSDPAQGRYYVTETNLPWVIEIPTTFDYPVETADILYAYLKFRDWAESSGQLYPDWYKDLPGYREPANIYKTANP